LYTCITFHLLLYIPEFTVVDDVVADEDVVAVTNRTQINDDNATSYSLHRHVFPHVLVLRYVSCTGPMCFFKGGRVSRARLAEHQYS